MRFERALAQRLMILARQAVALGLAAVGWIERAEPADGTLGNGALRLIGGGVPQAAIIHRGERVAAIGIAAGIAQHRVQFALVVGTVPWPVIVLQLQRSQ